MFTDNDDDDDDDDDIDHYDDYDDRNLEFISNFHGKWEDWS